jgi:integrase
LKINITKRGKVWYLNFRYGGRRYNWSVSSKKGDAEEAKNQTMKAILTGTFTGSKPWVKKPKPEKPVKTLRELCDEVLATLANRRESTLATYAVEMNKICRRLGGDTPVSGLTPRVCEKFEAGLVKDYQGKYTNHLMEMFRRIIVKAVKWGYLDGTPLDDPEPQKEREREVFLEPDEVDAILDHCEPWLRPIVETLLHTSARPGEWLGDKHGRPPLRWAKVDLRKRQVELTTRKHRTRQEKKRLVPINDDLCRVLAGLPSRVARGPVFLDPKGRVLKRQRVLSAFQRAVRRAGVEKELPVRLYDLRHTSASCLAQRGVPLYTIAKILGHSSIKMTERYSHLEVDHLRDAMEVLGDGSKTDSTAVG